MIGLLLFLYFMAGSAVAGYKIAEYHPIEYTFDNVTARFGQYISYTFLWPWSAKEVFNKLFIKK